MTLHFRRQRSFAQLRNTARKFSFTPNLLSANLVQKKCKLRLNEGQRWQIPYFPSNLKPHVNWQANWPSLLLISPCLQFFAPYLHRVNLCKSNFSCSGNRAEIAVLMCEQSPIHYRFLAGAKAIRYSVNKLQASEV